MGFYCPSAGLFRTHHRQGLQKDASLRQKDRGENPHPKKGGVPFLLHRYRKRTGLLAGLLAAVVLLGYMSGFVWKIEVTGNEAISTQEILAALDELGFRRAPANMGWTPGNWNSG